MPYCIYYILLYPFVQELDVKIPSKNQKQQICAEVTRHQHAMASNWAREASSVRTEIIKAHFIHFRRNLWYFSEGDRAILKENFTARVLEVGWFKICWEIASLSYHSIFSSTFVRLPWQWVAKSQLVGIRGSWSSIVCIICDLIIIWF